MNCDIREGVACPPRDQATQHWERAAMGLGASSEQPAGGEGFHLHGVSRGGGRSPGRVAQPEACSDLPACLARPSASKIRGSSCKAHCKGLGELVGFGKAAEEG